MNDEKSLRILNQLPCSNQSTPSSRLCLQTSQAKAHNNAVNESFPIKQYAQRRNVIIEIYYRIYLVELNLNHEPYNTSFFLTYITLRATQASLLYRTKMYDQCVVWTDNER